MKHTSLTVILPTYNETDNIIPLIRAILNHTPRGTEILVVDDNSPDGTALRVRQFIKTHNTDTHVKLMVRTVNRGLTNSLNAGIVASNSDIVIWMDCDFSHPPEVIPLLLTGIRNGADIALATRKHMPLLTGSLNRCVMALFGRDISDYTTGFLATRRTILQSLPLRGDYGEYCIDLLVRAKRQGYAIREIPYDSPPRKFGASKTAPDILTFARHGLGYVRTVFQLL